MCVYIYIYIHAYTYTHIYIYMYIYICTYTYISTLLNDNAILVKKGVVVLFNPETSRPQSSSLAFTRTLSLSLYIYIYIYIYISLNCRDILCLHILVYILSSRRIDFMVSSGNWLLKPPWLIVYCRLDLEPSSGVCILSKRCDLCMYLTTS